MTAAPGAGTDDRLLGAQLPRLARTRPTEVALAFGRQTWTYAEFDRAIGGFAAALRAQGVQRGDRMVMAGLPRPEAMITMFALSRLGAVLVPVHAASTGPELDVIFAATPPVASVGDAEFLARVSPGRLRFCWDGGVPGTRHLHAGEDLPPVQDWAGTVQDDAIIAYTSGTSGHPKAAVLTHDNLHWSARNALLRLDIGPTDAVLVATPLAHVAVLGGLPQYAWIVGATVILADRFDPDRFADAIRDHDVTIAFAVSAMLGRLVNSARWDEIRASSLRWVLAGGGPPLLSATISLLDAGIDVINSYGLTETSAGVTYADPADVEQFPTSAGRIVEHVALRVVTSTGTDAEAGVAGEIWLRGPSIARQYVVADGSRTPALDQQHWLHTGDCGSLDSAGRLFVTGRLKDTIVTGGENVDPVEVENAILAVAGVREVAIIGSPDDVWGQIVTAVVVLAPGESTTIETLRNALELRLSAHKRPRRLVLVDALPRTPTGKLKRGELTAAVLSSTPAAPALPSS